MTGGILVIWIGFILDLILGDPPKLYHPVRWFGLEISVLERLFLGEKTSGGTNSGADSDQRREKRERAQGAILAVIVMATAFVVSALILWICYHIHIIVGIAAEGWLCYRMIAVRCLKDESMPVCRALQKHDLPAARKAIARIVGRDTDALDEEGVAKAAVETVAENAADGTIAPLFYMMFFGAVGGFVYKAVNTMDSMIGYKNDRYQYFGTVAAKIDDVLNFIPARLCGLLIILCSWGKDFDRNGAWRIWRRDRYNHKSPNSAQSESAMAGALGVELAGNASYFGKIVEKPTIGDRTRAIVPEDIILANRMLYRIAWAMMIVATVVRVLIFSAVII